MASNVRDELESALAPLADEHGVELWTIEVSGGSHRPVIRVFLDKTGGVTCDDLTEANAWIGHAIDDLGVPAGPFVLEVSSPGVERSLRGPADYARFLGSKAEVRLRQPRDGRKTFTGTIAGAEDDAVTLDVDGTPVRIMDEDIAKARLRADFGSL